MTTRTLTEEEARAAGLLDRPREIRITKTPDAITRRLALAALRLAICAAAVSRISWWEETFHVASKWAGGKAGEDATRPINAAIDEAVAALREAGEVSE